MKPVIPYVEPSIATWPSRCRTHQCDRTRHHGESQGDRYRGKSACSSGTSGGVGRSSRVEGRCVIPNPSIAGVVAGVLVNVGRETPFFGTHVRPALAITRLLSFAFVRMKSRNEAL